jgi:hypothetical protein
MARMTAPAGEFLSITRKRPLASWEIAARRRNGRKSKGPRTPEGKRRAALNLLRWRLCPKEQEKLLTAQGEDPREFRRLHRELFALLEPTDAVFEGLMSRLAGEFWNKLRLVRMPSHSPDDESKVSEVNGRIEVILARLVTRMMIRTPRKWYRSLRSAAGALIGSPAELRNGIESRMSSFSSTTVRGQGLAPLRQGIESCLPTFGSTTGDLPDEGLFFAEYKSLKMRYIIESTLRANLALVSCLLSTRYT